MERGVKILALETSCDETAAAVVEDGRRVLASTVASQIDWHRKFGGVVPEIASRKHLEFLDPVLDETLDEAGVGLEDIAAVAATYGPGLVGALLVGLSAAKALAYARGLPFIGVNHIAGHIYANFISREIEPPVVCLTVSGGHSDLLYFEELEGYEILGSTRDDAAGEAFDKVARYLELGYPGGPVIEELAGEGDPDAVDFPRSLLDEDTYDFSFSGLKTAVINYVHGKQQRGEELDLPGIAASFQQAVIDILSARVLKAVKEYDVNGVILAGGVAANRTFRAHLRGRLEELSLPLYYPEPEYCTDNAAMIGAAAFYQYSRGDFSSLDLNADPRLRL
ncbi:MAG: tRNA (adenosine(37)-N6)-threonylcarbamoyltransferase complex transferase subunit TsaD [Halanaerobiaceae bacterium]